MLYDKRWDAKTKADPFKIENLIAWLERQPAETEYCYTRPETCLIAEYLKAHNVEQYSLSSDRVKDLGWMEIVNPVPFMWPDAGSTYGAALERARAIALR